jgi:class 3 adenylate cyclase
VIFVFTSLVFVIYDRIVSRRQRIVMDRAMASGAIVSSLFPEKVRNQLYKENEEKAKQVANSNDFMNNGGAGGDDIKTSRPIADLFENTTIFFADIVGFTAWSSKRTPVEVFELLEAIYGVFDAIAVKRGVFKIETIGDCYVAVTGIPNAQIDHAVIMARFARDCMMRLRELLHDLSATMGADTADLDMRVGLHSGATTAGVLRGDKSRFQLFGDTVNTAARMESNGVAGHIHVSESTSLALSARGKGHWSTPREDKIVAKGKGEMQTYWVQIKSEGSMGSTSIGASSQDD